MAALSPFVMIVVVGGSLEDVVMLEENEFVCFLDLGIILIHLVTTSSIPHRQLLRCPQ